MRVVLVLIFITLCSGCDSGERAKELIMYKKKYDEAMAANENLKDEIKILKDKIIASEHGNQYKKNFTDMIFDNKTSSGMLRR